MAVRQHLAELPTGGLALVACSGGADSLALAAAAAFEAPRAGLQAGAVTVDHGVQPGSSATAAGVAATMKELGLDPVAVTTVTVDPGHDGPEGAARRARYSALDAAAERHGAVAVLLAHTRDDQAETVLLGLARGSGARSLAGMPPVSSNGRYRRPFLDVSRETTRAACAAEGLEPWEDPHNTDRSYARVRVRLDALPALERALGPGVADALARTAAQLREDADALDRWASETFVRATAHGAKTHRSSGGSVGPDESVPEPAAGTAVELDVAVLAGVPGAVRKRVLKMAALMAGAPATDLFAVHIDALDDLVTAWRGQLRVDLPGMVKARRRYGRLVLARADGGDGS